MRIVIRQLGQSTLGDRFQSFDQPVVRIGRRPDNDIAYDPIGDPLVSGYHLEIRTEQGRITLLDLNSSNGTFIGTRRISPGLSIEIAPPEEVLLGGRDGPVLKIELETNATTASPDAVSTRRIHTPPSPQVPRVSVESAIPAGSELQRPTPEKRSFGEQTMLRMMSHATRHERRRVLAMVSALFVVVAAASYSFFRINDRPPTPSPSFAREDRREELQRHLTEARSRVYVVIRQQINGHEVAAEDAFGTAWSVRPGRLATNGHVADIIRQAKGRANVRFLARNSGSNDMRISGYDIHPGWEEFQRLESTYLKGRNSDDAAAVRTGCDVALLIVDKRDVVHQSAPLPLADDVELRSLKQADPIGFSGYPLEGIGINTKQPVALVRTGDMSAMTDFFLGETAFENAHLIAFTMAGAGGASGSPVLAASGKVICLLYSGDVGGQTSVARISVAGGFTYGQRVDLLRELLDGTAAAQQAVRTSIWEAKFKGIAR
jgi:pSer/pThr/pTyr-binding forkhead associated (FHA) protein